MKAMNTRGPICIAGAIVVLAGALIFQSVPNFLDESAARDGASFSALLALAVMLAGFIILVRELRRKE